MTENLQVWYDLIKNYIKYPLEYFKNDRLESEKIAFYLIITLPIIDTLWKAYLRLRHYWVCKRTEAVPRELVFSINRTTLHQLREEIITQLLFLFVYDSYDILIATLILFSRGHAWFWNYIIKETGWNSQVALNITWLFFFIILHIVLFLPLTMYKVFLLNEEGAFLLDAANNLIFLPVITIFMVIITYLEYWCVFIIWIILAISCVVFEPRRQVILRFNLETLVPLQDSQLITEINTLANQFSFPLKHIYVTSGHCPPGHSAFIYRNQLIIHNNLCQRERYTIDEVIALLTHEFGHWMSGHFITMMFFEQIILLLIVPLFQFFLFHPALYKILGFDDALVVGLGEVELNVPKAIIPGYEDAKPVVIGFLVVHYAMLPYYSILQFFLNYLSTKMEFHADGYCVVLNRSRSLKNALLKKYKYSLQFPVFDNLYSLWNFSRPSILERIKNLDQVT